MKHKLQKGFTLVELIVVIILMGVLMTAVVMVMRPAQNTYKNVTNKAYEEQTSLNLSKLINGNLRYATGIKVMCNDGTTPTSGDVGTFKRYIKLSNDYRSTSVKGARGNYEKGEIASGTLKAVWSSVSSASFDEYDFQFSIPKFNSKDEEASLTIAMTAMPMDIGSDQDISAATDISKPNPSFVPDWDKAFEFSETFEFVNIRHKAVINRKVQSLSIDPYNAGTPAADFETDHVYYDPQSGNDNTIWIFYTLPQEAETLSAGGGGGGGGGAGGTSGGGTSSGGTSSGGTSSGGTSGGGTSSGGSTDSGKLPEESMVTLDSTPTSSTESTGGGSTESGTNNDQPTYGSASIVVLGSLGNASAAHSYDYEYNSGVGVSGTSGGSPYVAVNDNTLTVAFTGDGQFFKIGSLTIYSEELKWQDNKTWYLFNGNNYGTDKTAAEKDRDVLFPSPYAKVHIEIIPSVYNQSSYYYVGGSGNNASFADESNQTFDVSFGSSSLTESDYIEVRYKDASILKRVKVDMKDKPDESHYFYEGTDYSTAEEANAARDADLAVVPFTASATFSKNSADSYNNVGQFQIQVKVNSGKIPKGYTYTVELTFDKAVTVKDCWNSNFTPSGSGNTITMTVFNKDGDVGVNSGPNCSFTVSPYDANIISAVVK